MTPRRWREAMEAALYGPDGFFVTGAGPAGHFRTSVHVSPIFTAALLRLLEQVDAALERPERLDVVDVGAGRGELLTALVDAAPPPLRRRLRLTAVELAPRPQALPPEITWRTDLPAGPTGLLLATEWLDNVPLDLAEHGPDGWRYVEVDPQTGTESLGGPVDDIDGEWLTRWWPVGGRAEIGRPRDAAWARAVTVLDRGLALVVDYGHLRDARPHDGTLTGFRYGRQVRPVPDGSCDITAHVAIDAVAAAGATAADCPYELLPQREALRALGVAGKRPPLTLARTDPAGYVRALADASAAAELTDPAGLGAHWWLLQPVRMRLPKLSERELRNAQITD